MVVIARIALVRFWKQHPVAEAPLARWYDLTREADWSDFGDLRRTFGSADAMGDGLVVFNIGGNKYRLVAYVLYGVRTLYIKHVFTHPEYDAWNARR